MRHAAQHASEMRMALRIAVDALEKIQAGRPTTGSDLDATWKLLWSSEKVLLRIMPALCTDIHLAAEHDGIAHCRRHISL